MAHGQKNYADMQGGGNGGKPAKYRINQIGCFVTAFSNLLELRFGISINPSALNRLFIDRNIFIDVDDGVKDDLGWQSITAYNGQIVTTDPGSIDRNCIVRIKTNGTFGTHFCLVEKVENGIVYIVDSWDGVVKRADFYGAITGFAKYAYNKPQVVTPTQGGDKPMNPSEENEAYQIVLERPMEHKGSGRTGIKFIRDAVAELNAKRQVQKEKDIYIQALQNDLSALKAQADALQERPTKAAFDELHTNLTVCQEGATAQVEHIADLEKKIEEQKAREYKPTEPEKVVRRIFTGAAKVLNFNTIKELLARIKK